MNSRTFILENREFLITPVGDKEIAKNFKVRFNGKDITTKVTGIVIDKSIIELVGVKNGKTRRS